MTESCDANMQVTVKIEGRVQGVGFRANARRRAEALGVSAEPENMDDGSVRIAVSGQASRVDSFVEWCREGPRPADVTSVSIEDSDS